jgi:hypothetical protein
MVHGRFFNEEFRWHELCPIGCKQVLKVVPGQKPGYVSLSPGKRRKQQPAEQLRLLAAVQNHSRYEKRRRIMTRMSFMFALPLVLIAFPTGADDSKKTRVGTCNDAKNQMEYFCNPANAASDSMVAIGTACTNAKNNVKEACEGIVEADKPYQFDDKDR